MGIRGDLPYPGFRKRSLSWNDPACDWECHSTRHLQFMQTEGACERAGLVAR